MRQTYPPSQHNTQSTALIKDKPIIIYISIHVLGFNFAATPLDLSGTKIVAHIKPSVRRTWELNGEIGWYVGPSMLHCRCVNCYFPRIKTPRDCDTVTFFPKEIPFPEVK